MARQNRTQILLALIVFIVLLFILVVPQLVTDYWWFSSLGFKQIFLINLEAKLLLFFAAGLLFLGFTTANLWYASRSVRGSENTISRRTLLIVSVVLAFFVGRFAATKWETFLRFLRQNPFGIEDPVFLKDISFYVFSLPFMQFIWTFIVLTLVITLLLVLIFYFQSFIMEFLSGSMAPEGGIQQTSEKFNFKKELNRLKTRARMHISLLVALFFFVVAFGHYLSRFSILYSQQGAVVGAGYTEINAQLPIINILMLVSVLLGILALFAGFLGSHNIKKKMQYFVYVLVLYLVIAGIGLAVVPAAMQSLVVSPNEFNLEKPYIEDNINFTLKAYDLHDVNEKPMNFEQNFNEEMLNRNRDTVDNIRVLDWRPLTQTYKQTQEIRTYYDLSEIDIGRYDINGKYTQVMLAPRELDQQKIQDKAQTWVNKHLVFTHGYGAVMSPVNNVTSEGLPSYFIKDIPPKNTVNDESIDIDTPQIYYGQQYTRYVIANSNTEEFDYPEGDSNKYMHYDGSGGVQLDSLFKNLMMAVRFWDIKLLLSGAVDEDSRIMFNRNIQDRVSKITPFLKLDGDPYMVINNGKMYWMQDAYTVTDKYPYADMNGNFNYIRNSVKIVVDAYTGDINYYMIEKDPIMDTYSDIYPGEFKDFEQMPDGLKKHIRYPEALFKIQSDVYKTYHMKDPNVFYNKEDAWEIPNEIYGTGQRVKVEPYYVIMKLPGEEEAEFVLMNSFTPATKDNMISWMAARSDGENYGKISLYKFPKDRLAYGPSQVEATIDQDTEISRQLTLWSQRGSSILRGNLLVIPIEDSVLYVEPLYIQSEQGQLPQMKRVIVSDGDSVVMRENLEKALEAMFLEQEPAKTPAGEGVVTPGSFQELVEKANEDYNDFLNSMTEQQWKQMGESIEDLGDTLEKLSSK